MSGGVFVEGYQEMLKEAGVVGGITLVSRDENVLVYVDNIGRLFYMNTVGGSGLKSWPGGSFEMNVESWKVVKEWGNLLELGWYQNSKGQLYKWNGESWDGNVPSEPDSELEYLG